MKERILLFYERCGAYFSSKSAGPGAMAPLKTAIALEKSAGIPSVRYSVQSMEDFQSCEGIPSALGDNIRTAEDTI